VAVYGGSVTASSQLTCVAGGNTVGADVGALVQNCGQVAGQTNRVELYKQKPSTSPDTRASSAAHDSASLHGSSVGGGGVAADTCPTRTTINSLIVQYSRVTTAYTVRVNI
jgi:hypothetical protein